MKNSIAKMIWPFENMKLPDFEYKNTIKLSLYRNEINNFNSYRIINSIVLPINLPYSLSVRHTFFIKIG